MVHLSAEWVEIFSVRTRITRSHLTVPRATTVATTREALDKGTTYCKLDSRSWSSCSCDKAYASKNSVTLERNIRDFNILLNSVTRISLPVLFRCPSGHSQSSLFG